MARPMQFDGGPLESCVVIGYYSDPPHGAILLGGGAKKEDRGTCNESLVRVQ